MKSSPTFFLLVVSQGRSVIRQDDTVISKLGWADVYHESQVAIVVVENFNAICHPRSSVHRLSFETTFVNEGTNCTFVRSCISNTYTVLRYCEDGRPHRETIPSRLRDLATLSIFHTTFPNTKTLRRTTIFIRLVSTITRPTPLDRVPSRRVHGLDNDRTRIFSLQGRFCCIEKL